MGLKLLFAVFPPISTLDKMKLVVAAGKPSLPACLSDIGPFYPGD
jgi:hypothetical protein